MISESSATSTPQAVVRRLRQTAPNDEFNQELVRQVRPPEWVNPDPAARYNLVVIGAGTAGLVAAAGAAGMGAKVALIERDLLGGDCLNVGCVPSKALIAAGRAAAAVKAAGEFGVHVNGDAEVDFAAAMRRMRQLRAGISPHDSAARFRDLGVDVFIGDAKFTGRDTVSVGDTTLRFKRAVIATGARAAAPPITGLDHVPYLTNETVFSLTERPRRLGVIGAGPIGCELAQTFARLGSQVYLVEAASGVLPREDADAGQVVRESMVRDGVRVLCCGRELEIRNADGQIRLTVQSEGRAYDEPIDQLLVAVGRAPNVDGLNLEVAGVEYEKTGVQVDDRLRTTNPHVYAAGDVCSRYQFTHAADFQARIVIQNALFMGRKKTSSLVIPWCTYTSPEVAHVGISERQAEEDGVAIDTYRQPFREVDRAILEGRTDGFVKVHVKQGTDQILGATVVGEHAGDLISEITLAMTHGLGVGKIGSTIHPYPTEADAIRKLGDQYSRTRLTPLVKSLFTKWLAWTR